MRPPLHAYPSPPPDTAGSFRARTLAARPATPSPSTPYSATTYAHPGYTDPEWAAFAEAERDAGLMALVRALVLVALIGVMVFASGAVVNLLFIDIYNPTESPAARLAWLPVYAVAGALVAARLPIVLRQVSRAPFLVLAVLVVGLSMIWSVDPALTTRRAVALLASTCLGLGLAAALSWSRLIQGLAVAFLVLALLSFAVVLIDPGRGLMQEIYPGAWQGPWTQKNDLGGMMAKGVIAALGALAVRPGRWWLWAPTLLLCLALVGLSTSKTALLVSVGSLGLFGWIALYRAVALLRPVLVAALLAAAGGLALALAMFPEEMLGLIGKDPTFTGRTDIWSALRLAIGERVWLGYGYGAFWNDPLGPSYTARTLLQWDVPSAHNGWVEIWLHAGVGLVVLFGLHLLMVLGACGRGLARGGAEIYWMALFTMAFVGFSLSESAILQQNDLTWVMFVAGSVKLLAGERVPRRGARQAVFAF